MSALGPGIRFSRPMQMSLNQTLIFSQISGAALVGSSVVTNFLLKETFLIGIALFVNK